MTSKPLLEALVVDRESLRRVVKSWCAQLHETRNVIGTETPIAKENLVKIRYWEEVLDWIKYAPGRDLVLITREHQPLSRLTFERVRPSP